MFHYYRRMVAWFRMFLMWRAHRDAANKMFPRMPRAFALRMIEDAAGDSSLLLGALESVWQFGQASLGKDEIQALVARNVELEGINTSLIEVESELDMAETEIERLTEALQDCQSRAWTERGELKTEIERLRTALQNIKSKVDGSDDEQSHA